MHHQASRSKQSVPCESIIPMTVFCLHMMPQNYLLFTKFLTLCTSFLYVLRSLHKSENKSERTHFETRLFCIPCGPITCSMVNAVLWISSNSWVTHQTTHEGHAGSPDQVMGRIWRLGDLLSTALVNVSIFFWFWLKLRWFISDGSININPALVQEMAWGSTGNKPFIWTNDDPVHWHKPANRWAPAVLGKQQQQASNFQIECICPSGKWIVKINYPNVAFTFLKYIKPIQFIWKSEIRSRPSDKSCRYSTCLTVIFTRLRRSDEWNFEPWAAGFFSNQWTLYW